jgi:hypothetical protein
VWYCIAMGCGRGTHGLYTAHAVGEGMQMQEGHALIISTRALGAKSKVLYSITRTAAVAWRTALLHLYCSYCIVIFSRS